MITLEWLIKLFSSISFFHLHWIFSAAASSKEVRKKFEKSFVRKKDYKTALLNDDYKFSFSSFYVKCSPLIFTSFSSKCIRETKILSWSVLNSILSKKYWSDALQKKLILIVHHHHHSPNELNVLTYVIMWKRKPEVTLI